MAQGDTEKHIVYRKMLDLRLACDQEIRAQRQKASETAAAFRRSLLPIKAKAGESVADGEKLANLKAYLRELEDDLRETLIVKNCKEAKHVSTFDYLSSAKARTEELRKNVQEQRARKDEYEAMISLGLEKLDQDIVDGEDIKDAISWYDKVLGFHTEGGEGVKFIFNKIDLESPKKEYSFTIRLNGDTYNLLQCDPYVQDIKELLQELNQTNGLFKFVRTMREKFQAAAQNGASSGVTAVYSELSTIMISSPPPASIDSRSDSSNLQNDPEILPRDKRYHPQQKSSHNSDSSASRTSHATRRSPRLKANQLRKS